MLDFYRTEFCNVSYVFGYGNGRVEFDITVEPTVKHVIRFGSDGNIRLSNRFALFNFNARNFGFAVYKLNGVFNLGSNGRFARRFPCGFACSFTGCFARRFSGCFACGFAGCFGSAYRFGLTGGFGFLHRFAVTFRIARVSSARSKTGKSEKRKHYDQNQ